MSPEDCEIAEKESKIYVSGEISFIKDDPGRQEIGSFNPTTDTEWTGKRNSLDDKASTDNPNRYGLSGTHRSTLPGDR